MGHIDFDIESLAAYLHLLPQKVTRLAERGKLPGRKISGRWRFSREEIHHWLEKRIGEADSNEDLAKMEGVLDRNAGPEPATLTMTELLSLETISIPLLAKTRESVIHTMSLLAVKSGALWDSEALADALRKREEMHPTALNCGVALLHPRRPMPHLLDKPFLALGCTRQGIPFGGQGSGLTDIFFLICSTTDQGHLQTLARISRLINDIEVLRTLRAAETADEAFDALVERENELGMAP
ncbi:MAG: PTS sugar transporter subunit IIA [Pirellulales bacterium]|jgi:PTS system nitrogen regulatory IIA component|nr:PTS sugar transporter subunit IIA [Pirellulales bacterium]HJN65659.1 PTS sugar transporter subunit IIA [Pirellulales bacterium]|tara:strand:+ start:201 stop:920 length:720 start_codon:yes stop_codon:yes gene_type:complete